MQRTRWALTALVGGLALLLALGASAQPPAAKKTPATFEEAVASETKMKKESVEKVIKALGPAVRAQLSAGKQITLPGIGTFRVVRIAAYTDLGAGGRPVEVPARNFVEFVPGGEMEGAANAPGAVPAHTVQGYEFKVNPNANQGQRTPGNRTLGTRTR